MGESYPINTRYCYFYFYWCFHCLRGEGGAHVNMANFLLDSRHILNYWATFYFKLTNKEISHPTPFRIFLGRLMFIPFCNGYSFPESWDGVGWGLKGCLIHYSLSLSFSLSLSPPPRFSLSLFHSVCLSLSFCLSLSLSLFILICPDQDTNITLNQMSCLYAHLKKIMYSFLLSPT